MLNNKGFAVSTILYTLLIAFLLFLGATLAMFSSSNSIISNANNDLINGTKFEAIQVKPQGACTNDAKWYQSISDTESNTIVNSNTIVRIKSRYGTMYWPKDFPNSSLEVNGDTINIKVGDDNVDYANGKIKVSYDESSVTDEYGTLTFEDIETNSSSSVILADICE